MRSAIFFRTDRGYKTISELMINEQIRDREVRLIGESGEQLGIMPSKDALKLAKDAGVKELWLTHYSPSMNDPREYLHVARGIFPDTVAAKDGRTKELKYEEAE